MLGVAVIEATEAGSQLLPPATPSTALETAERASYSLESFESDCFTTAIETSNILELLPQHTSNGRSLYGTSTSKNYHPRRVFATPRNQTR
ncbi:MULTISPECIES: hypothetical protein [Microcoleus]|uniref:hypothetical protein n=1 Tax=Microcoleus TaxID=44471 RepID=UPI00168A1272|nr:hypothetical protein [Microcoleus sp. FACHB-84]MBD2008237.1 hypothetical protein [Microcoleus sp. FACHB-45]